MVRKVKFFVLVSTCNAGQSVCFVWKSKVGFVIFVEKSLLKFVSYYCSHLLNGLRSLNLDRMSSSLKSLFLSLLS